MSEKGEHTIPNWIKALLVLLVIVIAGQSWLIFRATSPGEADRSSTTEENADSRRVRRTPAFADDPFSPATQLEIQDWDPFAEMQRMRERTDRLFGEALGRFQQSERFRSLFDEDLPLSPRVDLRETKDAYEVTVDLPGVDPAAVEAHLDGQTLTIRAQASSQKEETETDESAQILRQERRIGHYQRSLQLEKPVDPYGMTSSQEEGVLRIHIPKQK